MRGPSHAVGSGASSPERLSEPKRFRTWLGCVEGLRERLEGRGDPALTACANRTAKQPNQACSQMDADTAVGQRSAVDLSRHGCGGRRDEFAIRIPMNHAMKDVSVGYFTVAAISDHLRAQQEKISRHIKAAMRGAKNALRTQRAKSCAS
jgi:hypothetical protein